MIAKMKKRLNSNQVHKVKYKKMVKIGKSHYSRANMNILPEIRCQKKSLVDCNLQVISYRIKTSNVTLIKCDKNIFTILFFDRSIKRNLQRTKSK